MPFASAETPTPGFPIRLAAQAIPWAAGSTALAPAATFYGYLGGPRRPLLCHTGSRILGRGRLCLLTLLPRLPPCPRLRSKSLLVFGSI